MLSTDKLPANVPAIPVWIDQRPETKDAFDKLDADGRKQAVNYIALSITNRAAKDALLAQPNGDEMRASIDERIGTDYGEDGATFAVKGFNAAAYKKELVDTAVTSPRLDKPLEQWLHTVTAKQFHLDPSKADGQLNPRELTAAAKTIGFDPDNAFLDGGGEGMLVNPDFAEALKKYALDKNLKLTPDMEKELGEANLASLQKLSCSGVDAGVQPTSGVCAKPSSERAASK